MEEVVVAEEGREGGHEVEYLKVDAFAVLWGTAFVEVEQPLQVSHQVLLEAHGLSCVQLQPHHPRDLSAHEVAGTHELMRVELVVVLLLY